MKFTADNKIMYGQDADNHIGIPPNIDFQVERLNSEMYRLTARGYGRMSDVESDYGHGPLYVYGLDDATKRLFDRAATSSLSTELARERIRNVMRESSRHERSKAGKTGWSRQKGSRQKARQLAFNDF